MIIAWRYIYVFNFFYNREHGISELNRREKYGNF